MNDTTLTDKLAQMQRLLHDIEAGQGAESMILHQNLNLVLRDGDGKIKQEQTLHNLITTAGKNQLLNSTTGFSIKTFQYIAIGTGATAAAIGDTTLLTEVARSISTISNPTANTYQAQFTFAAGTGTGAITEAGLLDAASVGNLLAHQVFSVINKLAADTLQITWSIT